MAAPCATGLEHGLKLGDAISADVELLVRVEGRGVGSDREVVGPVDEGGSEGYGGAVLNSEVQDFGRRENAIVLRRVGNRVADNLPYLDTPGLVKQQHGAGGANGTHDRVTRELVAATFYGFVEGSEVMTGGGRWATREAMADQFKTPNYSPDTVWGSNDQLRRNSR